MQRSSARELTWMAIMLGIASCRADPSIRIPYGMVHASVGAESSGGAALVAEGETITFEVRDDQTGKPLDGVRLFLGEREISGAHGRFELPISQKLMREQTTIRVLRPPGHKGKVRVGFELTVSGRCDERDQGTRSTAINLEDFRALDVDVDRIYLDRSLAPSDVAVLSEHLRRLRAAIREVTGLEAPPLAVAVTREEVSGLYAAPDAQGRRIWSSSLAGAQAPRLIGVLAHESTHLLFDQIRFPDAPELRYLEDGFAELVGHLTEQLVLGRELTPTLENRRRELAELKDARSVDLFALASEYAVTGTASAFIRGLCQPGVTDGYALGFAYWLGRAAGTPGAVRAQLAAWRVEPPKDAEALNQALSASGVSPRAFSMEQARRWIGAR